MSAYFQMGHDTENLVGLPGLDMYSGLILSPVNRAPDEMERYVGEFREKGKLNIIFDSQLYSPRGNMRSLPLFPYYPSNLETADLTSLQWWESLVVKLVKYCEELGVDAIASPMFFPKRGSEEYYSLSKEIFYLLSASISAGGPTPYLTLCIHLAECGTREDALRIASIVTQASPEYCYLVLEVDLEPRREIQDSENLASVMYLIWLLEKSGCSVLVAHCSSEMILYKAAGASAVATGKFFNLRRYTQGRFEEQEEGGRQIPYWFEESVLAYIREADLERLRRAGKANMIGKGNSGNEFGVQILGQLSDEIQKAWLALSWRQYLAWFGRTEIALSDKDAIATVSGWLKDAEANWMALEDSDVLFDEARNNGEWIRKWRQALSSFRSFL